MTWKVVYMRSKQFTIISEANLEVQNTFKIGWPCDFVEDNTEGDTIRRHVPPRYIGSSFALLTICGVVNR